MRTTRTTSLLLGLLASTFLAVTGCDKAEPPGDPEPDPTDECTDAETPGCVVRSDKQRITDPNVPDADLQSVVGGSTTFALDLYQQIKGKPGNLFYSPYSITTALGMTWAGARTQTEKDMAAVLGFDLGQEKTHAVFNFLDLELESRGQNAQASDGQGFRLRVANALWAQIKYPFETPFLDTLGQNYDAGVHVVDFEGNSQEAIDLINGWVDKQTESKIKELVSPETVNSSTRLVLTNAIYFNAAWSTPFEQVNTQDGPFTLLDDSQVTVPIMHGYQDTDYAEGDDYQALALPYDGYELSMILVLPKQGTFADFESSFDLSRLDAIDSAFQHRSVDVKLPRFKFESEFSLTQTLQDMGMSIAFSDQADFSGMSKNALAITDVVHKSFVGVNEAGTEAAAATAVIVGETSAPEPAAINLDHPFLFLIRDNATKTVLFVGHVADPSK